MQSENGNPPAKASSKKLLLFGCLGFFIVAAIIGVGLFFVGFGLYRNVITARNATDAAWAQVENQYERRLELIPNLIATVKGASQFEKETLLAITQARANVGQVHVDPKQFPDATTLHDFEAAQQGLGSALSRLMVVQERYPTLNATGAFRDLMAELAGTENRIATERMRFNESVLALNNKVTVPPSSWAAGFAGVTTRAFFQAQPGASKAPEVKF